MENSAPYVCCAAPSGWTSAPRTISHCRFPNIPNILFYYKRGGKTIHLYSGKALKMHDVADAWHPWQHWRNHQPYSRMSIMSHGTLHIRTHHLAKCPPLWAIKCIFAAAHRSRIAFEAHTRYVRCESETANIHKPWLHCTSPTKMKHSHKLIDCENMPTTHRPAKNVHDIKSCDKYISISFTYALIP